MAASYTVGIDIGGTFTDCVAVDDQGNVAIGKVSSTPPEFQRGFIGSIGEVANRLGLSRSDLLARTNAILHGCTVGTNALVEKRTAKVALLVTAGHRDTMFMMRAGERLVGSHPQQIAHLAGHYKPEPLVPRSLVVEIDERIAADGKTILALDEDKARETIRGLVADGVEAFAIALLWSTATDVHERTLARLVAEEAPEAFISVSSEVVPRVGEYQRTVATLINAMIGPVTSEYLARLEEELAALDYRGSLSIMTCAGGLIDIAHARRMPLLTIGSGPVAGLIGAGRLARAAATGASTDINVLTGDVGGTTFDVGVIRRGEPVTRTTTRYDQYEYFVPTLDVRSIGSGGGSIVAFDEDTRSLRVGPRSAAAVPGPAAYGRGGTQATVTDSAVVLGYLNPDHFLGGALSLDVAAARTALEKAGAPLGFSAVETAAAAMRIVDDQMADAILLSSTQQGYDPRACVMYAFGGGGGTHCPMVAQKLGITSTVVPLGDLAAGWSAFGVAAADAIIVQDMALVVSSPFDVALLNKAWSELEDKVRASLPASLRGADVALDRFVEMRYSLQVNELRIPAPSGTYGQAETDELIRRFENEYELLFGSGSGYPAAGFMITSLRVTATASVTEHDFVSSDAGAAVDVEPTSHRDVVWYEHGTTPQRTPVFDGSALKPGDRVTGQAIIEFIDTTVVLRQGQQATVDPRSSIVIEPCR
ncbi:MAG: hydantoinase/oxoprolinase family protein [Actinomycetota bacterium]